MFFHLHFFKSLTLKFYLLLLFYLCCQITLAQNTYLNIKSDVDYENKSIDSIQYLNKHANTKLLLTEIENFSETLLKNGYLAFIKEDIQKTNDSTFLQKIKLGVKNKFIHIYVPNNIKVLEIEKDTLKIAISEVENFMNSKLTILEKKGFSLATIQLINFRKINKRLFADLNFALNSKRTLDDIVINGYDKFPESHKKQIKRLYKNKVFNQENLKKVYSDFAKFRFVNQIKYPEILFTADSTKVYVYLEKAKPNTFDGFIGFNTNDAKKTIINGYLDLQLQNIINSGEKIALYWKSDGQDQKTFNGSVEFPYVFKSPLGIKASLNIFKQDSIFQNTETALDIGYYFNYNTRFYVGYQSAESSDIQNTNSAVLGDFNNSFITSHLDFFVLNPDDFLFPDKTKIYFKLGLGKRELSLQTDKQYFVNLNISHNLYLNKKNSINIKSHNYYLKSNKYTINELHRFGGINSIRGFNENSLQGNTYASLLAEYRYAVNSTTYLHTITDYGYYQDKTSNTSGKLLGLGFGFGLITKNGLFNFIYANGNTNDDAIKTIFAPWKKKTKYLEYVLLLKL